MRFRWFLPVLLIMMPPGLIADDAPSAPQDQANHQREVEDLSRRVVQRELFAEPEPSQWSLSDWLQGLFESDASAEPIESSVDGTRVLQYVGWGLIIMTTLGILIWAIWMIRKHYRQREQEDARGRFIQETLGPLDLEETDFDKIYQRGLELMRRGELDPAVRHFYVSGVLMLDRQQLIEFRPGRTNRQLLGQLRSRPEYFKPLRHMTRLFDDTVYAGAHPPVESVQAMRGQLECLRQDDSTASV